MICSFWTEYVCSRNTGFVSPVWENTLRFGLYITPWVTSFEWNLTQVIFKIILAIDGWGIFCDVVLRFIVTWPHWWYVNIGSGKGLVLPSNKLLPEPMLTHSMSPFRITRPQWVNYIQHKQWIINFFQHLGISFTTLWFGQYGYQLAYDVFKYTSLKDFSLWFIMIYLSSNWTKNEI